MTRPARSPQTGRAATVAAMAVALAVTASCTSSGAGPKPVPRPPLTLTWTKAATLPGVRATSFTADQFGGEVYVGGSLPAGAQSAYSGPLIKGGARKPVLWTGRLQTWTQVPLGVTSFYGAQATLASLGAFGLRVVALGAVAGGAHANPRPSFFAGGPFRVVEREQNFYVYGGENAVGIVAVGALPRMFLMVGQWAPDGHRASGALWTSPDGTTFVRHDEIPGLGDSAGGQRTTSPQAVAPLGGRGVVVGSVTDLTKPTLSVAPAVWTTDDGLAVSQGRLQSAADVLGAPTAVDCDVELPSSLPSPIPSGYVAPGSCIAAGMVSAGGTQQLAAWRMTLGDKPTDVADGHQLAMSGCAAPAPAPDPGSATPKAPVVRAGMGADGVGWVVASTSAAGVVCRVDKGGRVQRVALPTGCVPQAVLSEYGSAVDPKVDLFCARPTGVDVYVSG